MKTVVDWQFMEHIVLKTETNKSKVIQFGIDTQLVGCQYYPDK